MEELDVLSLDGKSKGKIELPSIFNEQVSPELIQRAVLAENTRKLQPQAHYPLAGMQTTARYYGKMHSYRTGRHMGIAIRPREKLGGGIQGKVKRIPSSVKGKRAHPHLAEKRIIEEMNIKEYQKALKSAVSATLHAVPQSSIKLPIVVSNEIESVAKTKELVKVFGNLKLDGKIAEKKLRIRKGLRRSSKVRRYKKSLLLIISKDDKAIRAARNIAGVDASAVSDITATMLAPGGAPGRITVWSEAAIKNIGMSINERKLK